MYLKQIALQDCINNAQKCALDTIQYNIRAVIKYNTLVSVTDVYQNTRHSLYMSYTDSINYQDIYGWSYFRDNLTAIVESRLKRKQNYENKKYN